MNRYLLTRNSLEECRRALTVISSKGEFTGDIVGVSLNDELSIDIVISTSKEFNIVACKTMGIRPISEDDIRRISHTMPLVTKLPHSNKDLFNHRSIDYKP